MMYFHHHQISKFQHFSGLGNKVTIFKWQWYNCIKQPTNWVKLLTVVNKMWFLVRSYLKAFLLHIEQKQL